MKQSTPSLRTHLLQDARSGLAIVMHDCMSKGMQEQENEADLAAPETDSCGICLHGSQQCTPAKPQTPSLASACPSWSLTSPLHLNSVWCSKYAVFNLNLNMQVNDGNGLHACRGAFNVPTCCQAQHDKGSTACLTQ